MKSLSNKAAAALVSIWLLASLGGPAAAGVSKVQMAAADASTAKPRIESEDEISRVPREQELPTSVANSQRNRSSSIFQCWQEGRLLLDERDWQIQGNGASGPDLRSSSGPFAKMRLMQFGDTFCALRHDVR